MPTRTLSEPSRQSSTQVAHQGRSCCKWTSTWGGNRHIEHVNSGEGSLPIQQFDMQSAPNRRQRGDKLGLGRRRNRGGFRRFPHSLSTRGTRYVRQVGESSHASRQYTGQCIVRHVKRSAPRPVCSTVQPRQLQALRHSLPVPAGSTTPPLPPRCKVTTHRNAVRTPMIFDRVPVRLLLPTSNSVIADSAAMPNGMEPLNELQHSHTLWSDAAVVMKAGRGPVSWFP